MRKFFVQNDSTAKLVHCAIDTWYMISFASILLRMGRPPGIAPVNPKFIGFNGTSPLNFSVCSMQ